MPTPIYPAYPSIDTMTPYKTGKPIDELAREIGMDPENIVKLASNENPLGCSPKATDAMQLALKNTSRYPDGSGYALKCAILAHHQDEWGDLDLDHITLGNGSNDILDLIARSFVSSRDSVVYSQYAFAVYMLATKAVGAEAIVVPAMSSGQQRFGHDLKAMAKAIQPNTKVVFLANPNNPTGTCFTHDALVEFLDAVPKDVVVVLDEAYVEYFDPEHYVSSISLLTKYSNLVISRTFSKAYGLASVRVGYAICHHKISNYINRLRHPFNVNMMAQAAATAALADQAFVSQSRDMNTAQMQKMTSALSELGFDVIPSHANFVTFKAGDADDSGVQYYNSLLKKGVITRPLAGYGMGAWLRVSIGLPAENDRLIDALKSL